VAWLLKLNKGTVMGIYRGSGAASSLGMIFLWLVFLFLWVYIGGISIHYDISFWMNYFTHKTVNPPMLPCCIAGLFLCEISVPVAIVTWIIAPFL
jgi:hypothetical protein